MDCACVVDAASIALHGGKYCKSLYIESVITIILSHSLRGLSCEFYILCHPMLAFDVKSTFVVPTDSLPLLEFIAFMASL